MPMEGKWDEENEMEVGITRMERRREGGRNKKEGKKEKTAEERTDRKPTFLTNKCEKQTHTLPPRTNKHNHPLHKI